LSQNGIEQNGREQWATRTGFILAAVGSAVGLGNIWRFSYAMGEQGGAAFLLVYIACVILIGFPIMMAEFLIGRKGKGNAVEAIENVDPGKPWKVAGGIGVLAGFMILSFYGVIAGWSLKYLVSYITGGLWSPGTDGYGAFFENFISASVEPVIWQLLFMAITIGIVVLGVKRGIEKANKILMPTLAGLVILLGIYSLTLGGAGEAFSFMFSPDWSALSEPGVYFAAMGQAFFTLSLGMGVMITYRSYLQQQNMRLPNATGTIITFDTLFAIFAGLMIFPALFAFGGDPASGPGLVFVVLPDVFHSMGGIGIPFGILFFFLLTAAALSSAISLLEVPTAYFMKKLNWNRRTTAIVVGILVFLLGIPSSLSMGALSDFTILGHGVLDFMDGFSGNILLPLGGLLLAMFVGWTWNRSEILKDSEIADTWWGKTYIFCLRYVAPIAIVIVLIRGAGDFFGW
jgi:NSS family neurotransmitter:Na+ symporter